jgi:MYXO-CTERM domain-containing protein
MTSVLEFVDHGPVCWGGGKQNPTCFERRGGEDFGYRPDAPPDERERALERWRAWWAENRGKDVYDRSEAKIAEEIAREARFPAEQAAAERRLGEVIAQDVMAGFKTLDPSNAWAARDIELIRAAGYEVTPDGRVVAPGADASGGTDAAVDEDSGDTVAETPEADAGGSARPRGGCGCATGGDPPAPTAAWWVVALVVGARAWRTPGARGRYRRATPPR